MSMRKSEMSFRPTLDRDEKLVSCITGRISELQLMEVKIRSLTPNFFFEIIIFFFKIFFRYMFYTFLFKDLQLTAEDQLANRASLSSIRSSRGLNLPGRTSSRMRQSRQNFTLEKTAEKSIPEERVI